MNTPYDVGDGGNETGAVGIPAFVHVGKTILDMDHVLAVGVVNIG